ncbi:MAG: hypothetical protein Q8M31_06125 [Beijerinckiaceae bacterium]|nr:hypothetical protein [Beijerinckiaceae bacterium]
MRVMKFATALAGASLGSFACSVAARAADLPSAAPPPPPVPIFTTWEFRATAYVWASGVKGVLATVPPLPAISVDASFGDVLKNLGGSLMGSFEAKYGRFILFNDIMYTKLKPGVSRARGPLAVSVNIESSSLVGLAAAGYRVIDGGQFTLDVFAGVRGFYMDNDVSVRVAAGPFLRGQTFGETKSWLDAVGGVRMSYQFDEQWFAAAIGFAGGGASKYQWDIYGGAGYSFNLNWAAFAGYRAFKVNYQDSGFIYDILQHGPLFGVQYRW